MISEFILVLFLTAEPSPMFAILGGFKDIDTCAKAIAVVHKTEPSAELACMEVIPQPEKVLVNPTPEESLVNRYNKDYPPGSDKRARNHT